MDAIRFVANYENFLDEIKSVIKPELYPIIEDLQQTDPHDLVSPDTWFQSENDARGYVWGMFIKRVRVSTNG
jgi:hypothetical protein